MPEPKIEIEYLLSRPISGNCAEPDPQFLISGLDDSNYHRRTAHPEQRFEVIGAEQMPVDDEYRRHRNRQSRERNRIAPSRRIDKQYIR